MTYDITNYQILTERDLREDDTLKFLLEDRTYVCIVCPQWIACQMVDYKTNYNETQILQDMKEIGIINEIPKEFCRRTYGYLTNEHLLNSIWPEVKKGDFPALTRCAFEIFNLLQNYKEGKNFSKIELTELALDIW